MLKQILACSVSREMNVVVLFSYFCLKNQLSPCSVNCHTHAMSLNCCASFRLNVILISINIFLIVVQQADF